jgi:hypothetical protein
LTIPGGPARASTGWSPTCSTTSGTRPTSWPRACTQRWEEETALDELKTHQRGPGLVLASTSKTPDGVRQQVWAHLLVHHALRAPGCRTAQTAGVGRGRFSFTDTLRAVRRSVTASPGWFPPERLVRALVWLRDDLLAHLLPTRRLRSQPRVVKRKMSNFGVKKAAHRHWPQPTRPPAQAVAIRRARPPPDP